MSGLLWINLIALVFVIAYAISLFVYVISTRIQYVRLGKKTEFDLSLKERLDSILVNVLGQKKLFKDKKSGTMHLIIFYGFFIVQLGLIELIIKGFSSGYEFPLGPVHPYFSLIQEWTTFLMMIAIVYGFYRRYGEKLNRLQWKRDGKALFVYIALFIHTSSILVGLGFEHVMVGHEPSFVFATFSAIIASLFANIGPEAGKVMFYVFWWLHLTIVFTFMVFMPQSKQFHEMIAIVNVFMKKKSDAKKLRKIDFEDETQESFGVGKITDFRQDQMIDFYACVECGRCTNMCPATGTGKMLSPMDLIVKMRDHLTNHGAAVTSKKPWVPTFALNNTKGNQIALAAAGQGAEEAAASLAYSPSLIGDVITEEEIWACTTCRNCEDQCPVMNEHVEKNR